MKSLRGTNASSVLRSATPSYWRGTCLITDPSPNHAPVPTATNVVARPSRPIMVILPRPSTTPIQWSTASPRWKRWLPFG